METTTTERTNDDEGGGDDSEEDLLLLRHRKEKKELQAKITSLKHASKNDRTKKKDLPAEIARLESELASKHAIELDEWKKKTRKTEDEQPKTKENEDEQEENDKNGGEEMDDDYSSSKGSAAKKVTKAQKRRDKKEAKAKETERAVVESASEVKQGVRYKEQQLFKGVLASKGLSFHHVPADGDCLYNALAHQLSLCGLSTHVNDLRHHAASIMTSNRDDYLPFLTNNNGDMLNEQEFEEYCAKLLRPGIWGGHPELVAISTYFQRPIEVLQADAAPILIGEQFLGRGHKPLTITYHRHAFRLGEHYNSTSPAKEGVSKEDDADDTLD